MSIIERFFPGTSLEKFRSDYWLYETLHVRAPLARFPEILANPAFSSLENAVRMRVGEYRVDMPAQDGRNRVSHIERADLDASVAGLHRSQTIYLGGLREEPLTQFGEQISAELDLPVFLDGEFLERYWVGFVAKPSKGLRWHWDKHHLFILQVLGRKKFLMARSQYFARPIVPPEGYDSWKKGMHPSLRGVMGRPIAASEIPSEYEEVVLDPGDAIFMPAGVWHCAESLEDSLHVGYAVKVPTLPELMMANFRLMHEANAAEFHVPLASMRDVKSLLESDDASNAPLQQIRRAWFSQMSRAMARLAKGDHLATFLQGITADIQRGVFSGELRDP